MPTSPADLITQRLEAAVELKWGEPASAFLKPFDIIEAASSFDLGMRYTTSGLKRIRDELDQGRPVTILLWYGGLPQRQDMRFTGAAYVILVGYDKRGYILHDSNWYGKAREKGVFMHVKTGVLIDAFGQEGAYHINQPPYQALYITDLPNPLLRADWPQRG